MRTIAVVLLFSILFSGCQKESVAPKFEALYSGTFSRISGNSAETAKVSNVSIRFREDTFDGISELPQYPAVGNGTYSMSQTKMNVMNECRFTANFDWTLIFNGEYKYEQSGDSLRIWRVDTDGGQDIYKLKKTK